MLILVLSTNNGKIIISFDKFICARTTMDKRTEIFMCDDKQIIVKESVDEIEEIINQYGTQLTQMETQDASAITEEKRSDSD